LGLFRHGVFTLRQELRRGPGGAGHRCVQHDWGMVPSTGRVAPEDQRAGGSLPHR
jgi:hypothetical protein